MYSPVKFHQCINQTKELNITNFLEMGPGSVLTNLVSKDFPNSSSKYSLLYDFWKQFFIIILIKNSFSFFFHNLALLEQLSK